MIAAGKQPKNLVMPVCVATSSAIKDICATRLHQYRFVHVLGKLGNQFLF